LSAGETATGGTAGVDTLTYGVKYVTGGITLGVQMTDVVFEPCKPTIPKIRMFFK
jgi:hypothetical protein